MNSLTQIYSLFLENKTVSTDSRSVTPGSIFFALKGPSFNGNAFAQKALESGAVCCVIDEAAYKTDERCILVDDVLKTLQKLALHHREQMGIPVIGIAGSNGKTTTRELITAVLQQKYRLLSTAGNLNNHIGVPLTLLKLSSDHELAIIEMGANHIGENAMLCEIAAPDYGMITNIGKDHLEGFGSLEGTAKASSELYYYLHHHGGTAFLNANDEWLVRMASTLQHKKTYAANYPGHSSEADYEGTLLSARPSITFSLEGYSKELHSVLSGEYNFDNIMAAVAIGRYFGVTIEEMAAALASYEPKNNRSQVVKKGDNTFYLDAYNANPSSMEVSLMNFAANDFDGKIAILGDMYELGEYTDKEHKHIAQMASQLGLEEVWLVGPSFARHAAVNGARSFQDAAEVKAYLQNHPMQNKYMFLKGSRGMKLESILAD